MVNEVKMNVYAPEWKRSIDLELLNPNRLEDVHVNIYFSGDEYAIQFGQATIDGKQNVRLVGFSDTSLSDDAYDLIMYFLVSEKQYIDLMELFIFCVMSPIDENHDVSEQFKKTLEGVASAVLDETFYLLNEMEAEL